MTIERQQREISCEKKLSIWKDRRFYLQLEEYPLVGLTTRVECEGKQSSSLQTTSPKSWEAGVPQATDGVVWILEGGLTYKGDYLQRCVGNG